jgi:hypothetical protein
MAIAQTRASTWYVNHSLYFVKYNDGLNKQEKVLALAVIGFSMTDNLNLGGAKEVRDAFFCNNEGFRVPFFDKPARPSDPLWLVQLLLLAVRRALLPREVVGSRCS